jgi:uncharacterized protein YyaL (SSP411 family)
VDSTRYTSWNGMLASALLRAGVVLDEPWAMTHALATLSWIRECHHDPSALTHNPGGVPGLLDDQVQVAIAAIDAFEVTGAEVWLDWAAALMERVWRDYRDPEGGLHDTVSSGGEGLLAGRLTPVEDAPTPSPNGVAAIVLSKLAAHTGEPRWLERRDAILTPFAGLAPALGVHGATLARALAWAANPETHLMIVEGLTPEDHDLARAMHREAYRAAVPRAVIRRIATDRPLPAGVPAALRGAAESGGHGTRAFLCTGTACQAPAATLADWQRILAQGAPDPGPFGVRVRRE